MQRRESGISMYNTSESCRTRGVGVCGDELPEFITRQEAQFGRILQNKMRNFVIYINWLTLSEW